MKDSLPLKLVKGFFVLVLLFLLIVAVVVITLGFTAPDKLYVMPVIGSVMDLMNGNSKETPPEEPEKDTDDTEDSEDDENKTETEEPDKTDKSNEEDDDSTINVAINEEDVDMIPNEDELSGILINYAAGINRVDGNIYNSENNTLLVYIAKNYFDSKNTASIDIDTKYATTKDNVHKFLSELTTTNYSELDALKTYTNFIRYTEKTGAYAVGKDINLLKREKFSISDLQFEEDEDGKYSGSAVVLRSLDNGTERELTHYSINFKFSINERFTYSKYKILDFSAANMDYMPDNTYHLERN